MRKTLFVLFVLLTFLSLFSCKKSSSPSGPVATATIDSSALVSVPGNTFYQTDGTYGFNNAISSFYIGKYKVTYKLWYSVYQWAITNGYTFQNAGAEGNGGTVGAAPDSGEYQPVTTVNWRDAIVWCNAYSLKSGLVPVYYSDSGFGTVIKDSTNGSYSATTCTTAGCFDNPYVNWNANGYRLPTEGEYQFAASYIDGTNWTPYDYASGATDAYTDVTATVIVAWYVGDCGSTQAVGVKAPNALGIYDMSGNVYEWCWDWQGTYPTTPEINYRGSSIGSIEPFRTVRGGCYNYSAKNLIVGLRGVDFPYSEGSNLGFRIAKNN
jgi:formylglycine-generating enzyme required for sulfatase activity